MRRIKFFDKINDASSKIFRTRLMKNNLDEQIKIDKLQNLRSIKDIPGPKSIPLFGNLFKFMPFIGEYFNVDNLTFMRMLNNKYGNIVKVDGLTRQIIFLFCPELCKNMYQFQGKWPMRVSLEPFHYYRECREHIYKGQYGLVTSQGESWHQFRSKVTPYMMRPDLIKNYVPRIHEISCDFIEKMRALRDPETLEMPENFMNELYKWTLETMCSIALNCRMGCLKSNLTADSDPQKLIDCTQEVFDLIYRLEYRPSLWKIYNTSNLKKLFEAFDTINVISEKYIKKTKMNLLETTDNTNAEGSSILEKLLSIDEQTAHVMALDILMTIDTTSSGISALLYHIANNMDKQEKLREEVISLLPDKGTPITDETLKNIPYTRSCIKESLRLFPIVGGISRTTPTNVSIGGYMIPKGVHVMACHGFLSLNPTYFPEPEKYIPERWMRDSSEYLSHKKLHSFAYKPFGYGVRACVGQRFAEMELEILLLNLIRNFRIEWHYGPIEYKSRLINTMSSPLKFKVIDL